MERQIEKSENFISIEAREGEKVEIKVGDEVKTFVMPFDGNVKLYIARERRPIHWQ